MFRVMASATLLFLCTAAYAQPTKPIAKVGVLLPWSPASGVAVSFNKALRQGLNELGYSEGQNLVLEYRYRYADGRQDSFAILAAELVRAKVDIIVTSAGPPALAVKRATNTIPIVFTQVVDPVEEGLVASLARPGGNITGLSQMGQELAGKRLELLKEAFPKISRVAAILEPASVAAAGRYKEMQAVGKTLAVQLQSLEVQSSDDIERSFKTATAGRAGGLVVLQSALINTLRERIVELAAKNRLPAMFEEASHVEAGGLMSYGPSFFDLQRRAATYVDKILKGTKPADLPVERPMKFEFVVNLKTAKQIGLTIPPNVLARADRVIR